MASSNERSRRAERGALPIVEQLDAIEFDEGGDGTLRLGGRARVEVTSLGKTFFPEPGFTKGDLLRYYATAAELLVPLTRDRPLAMRRFPNGVGGTSFYQHDALSDPAPGVRVESVKAEGAAQPRYVGGHLATIMYTAQLGAIEVHPWHSRVRTPEHADYFVIDLDPGPGSTFARVRETAGAVREALDALGLRCALKTSGSRGLHLAVALAPRTTYASAVELAGTVCAGLAEAHPTTMTVQRSLKKRPPGAIYLDYLQNAQGKTIAAAYCVRARPGATVSTPLRWSELDGGAEPGDFTIATVPARLKRAGDLWGDAMRKKHGLSRPLDSLRAAAGTAATKSTGRRRAT